MQKVTSRDGTQIAFDQTGSGQPVILVAGAFSYRKFPGSLELASLLSKDFTVINYDRRGRGDSTDTAPYAPEREIEDIEALINHVGGSAFVWGLSSGAVLALKAAASGLNIKKLAVYDPPFVVDPSGPLPPEDFITHVTELIAKNQRGDAVRYFMTKGMGAPGFVMILMRLMPGVWQRLTAVANTLPYDATLLQGLNRGQPLKAQDWAGIKMPTLVTAGSKSTASLQQAAKQLAAVLPNAQHRLLEGLSHTNIDMKVIAPVLKEFFR
jgi:pimeloyl-ACP methyl ester carboxylesterase